MKSNEYRLEALGEDHPVAVEAFVPFVISRLQPGTGVNEATLPVRLRMPGEIQDSQRMMRLFWSADSVPVQPLAVQESVITEWAALGMACVVLSRYSPLRLQSVAVRGERFDYWVTDGQHRYGLEVSGTMTGGLEGRHREKVRQLRENPFEVDGFVIAVAFDPAAVIFTFHRFRENGQ